VFGLGHLIPNSILKQCELKYFVDVNQGKESSVSRMGYRAFCSKCEGRFSDHGEVINLNSKVVKPFYKNQDEAIEVDARVDVRDNVNGNPWLYFCFISIVWRCLCFNQHAKGSLFNTLEYLRKFLLKYPKYDDHDIDSKVALFVFAPNSQLESKWKEDNETYKRFFDHMCAAICDCSRSDHTAAWVFMGPIHILMIYKSEDGDLHGPFGLLTKADLDSAKEFCIIKSTDDKISIRKKQARFFPMSMYPGIVDLGKKVLSDTVRVPSKKTAIDSTLPPVQATHLFLLPQSVSYTDGNFSVPKSHYQTTFSYSDNQTGLKIVGARRSKSSNGEKIIFVALEGSIKYVDDDGENKTGPLAMALNVGDDGKVSYLKGVNIPPKEKVGGQDLNEIRYKQIIEKRMDQLIKDDVAKW
jgi:hypothetical protein